MKRGISPLIATVLLIGATIMIAAIVSTFIINQTKKFEPEKFMGESSYCQDVVLGTKIISLDSVMQCSDDGMPRDCKKILNLVLVNKGAFTINAIDINAVGLGSKNTIKIEEIAGKGLKPGKKLCSTDEGCIPNEDIILGNFVNPLTNDRYVFYPGICKDKSVRIIPHINVEGEEIVCTQSEMIINAENSGCFN